MGLFAEPETIEKVKSLFNKTVVNKEYGKGKLTYFLNVTERQSDNGLEPGSYAVVGLDKKEDEWKITTTELIYKGEEGLRKMLEEWEEA